MSSRLPTDWFAARSLDQLGECDPFPTHVWDPFYPFPTFCPPDQQLGYGQCYDQNSASSCHTKIDWRQTEEAHILKLTVPAGLRKEDLNVMIEEGKVLRIEEGDQSCKAAQEANRHPFMQRLAIPCNAEVGGIRAEMLEKSVLTVTVPKKKRVSVVETKKVVVKIQ